jgi:hypothetical protein
MDCGDTEPEEEREERDEEKEMKANERNSLSLSQTHTSPDPRVLPQPISP